MRKQIACQMHLNVSFHPSFLPRRYYYLSFAALAQHPIDIVDIGVELVRKEDATPADHVLLGAISLMTGFPDDRDRLRHLTTVEFNGERQNAV